VSKLTQGEINTKPRNGEGSSTRGMMGEGCGWLMWERRESARLAPAESPVRIMFLGERWRFCVRWLMRVEACWSCRG